MFLQKLFDEVADNRERLGTFGVEQVFGGEKKPLGLGQSRLVDEGLGFPEQGYALLLVGGDYWLGGDQELALHFAHL